MVLRENIDDPATSGHSVDSWTGSSSDTFILDRFKFVITVVSKDNPTTTMAGSAVPATTLVAVGAAGAGLFVVGAAAVAAVIIKRRNNTKLPDTALKFPQGL
jgi:hypothetical protein